MPSPSRTPRPNPFYVLLILVSTLFVMTALGYLVGPYVEQQAIDRAGAGPTSGSRALASWFDRKGVQALTIEFAAMVIFGMLAMFLDRHFTATKSLR